MMLIFLKRSSVQGYKDRDLVGISSILWRTLLQTRRRGKSMKMKTWRPKGKRKPRTPRQKNRIPRWLRPNGLPGHEAVDSD